MAGIILTLLAIVAAIGFALYPSDPRQAHSEWRDSVPKEAMRIRPNKLPDERKHIER